MKLFQRVVYGLLMALVTLAVFFITLNYIGEIIRQLNSNISKCGWIRVALDANGDGIFTYRDPLQALLFIYINAVRQFTLLIGSTQVAKFLELSSQSCNSAVSHIIISFFIGSLYLIFSYAGLRLTILIATIFKNGITKKRISSVSYISPNKGVVDKLWAIQLPASLLSFSIIVISSIYNDKKELSSIVNPSKRVDASRVDSKPKDQQKSASVQLKPKPSNSNIITSPEPKSVDQPAESSAKLQPEVRQYQSPAPLQQQAPDPEIESRANIAQSEDLRVAQQRQEQLNEVERKREIQQQQADQKKISDQNLFEALIAGRRKGCGQSLGTGEILKRDIIFDSVAKYLAQGNSIDDAMRLAGTKSNGGAYIFIPKQKSQSDFFDMAVRGFCRDLTRPDFNEVGLFSDGRGAWLHIGRVFRPPVQSDYQKISERAVMLVNIARASSRHCGDKLFSSASPVVQSEILGKAAINHAMDMAQKKYYSHTGLDGSSPQDRAVRAGYPTRYVAENNDAGPETIDEAVRDWINSPGHCKTLMQSDLKELGIGYSVNLDYFKGIFWVKMMGNSKK